MCISHFSNRRLGAKDPLPSRSRFIQRFPSLRWVWVDVGIDPYEFFRGFRKNRGIVTGGNPRREPHQCELH